MFGRKRTPQVRRCWYSSAVDLPGITADQVWELVTPVVRQLRITHTERPYVAEGFEHRAESPNGVVFDISTPMGGTRLTSHVWRDLPEVWADDTWVIDSMQDFLDRVRETLGVPADARLPRDLVPTRAGPGLSEGPVNLHRASDHTLLPGVTHQQVWDLIRPAEAALYDPSVVEAYAEPGTGPGVGEIQVFVYEQDGARRVSRSRILHEDPPHLALTEILGDDVPHGMTFRLQARDDATMLQVTHGVDLLNEYVPDHVLDHRDFTASFFGWIRTALAE